MHCGLCLCQLDIQGIKNVEVFIFLQCIIDRTSKFPGPPEPSRHSEPLGPSGSNDHSRPY